MKEVWKDVLGFEGYYKVNDKGEVKSLIYKSNRWGKHFDRNKTLKVFDSSGYHFSVLFKNKVRKKYYIHRLLAENFIPNPNNKPEVNHIDGNKTNNKLENLEWVTRRENINHAIKIGLTIPNTKKVTASSVKTNNIINFNSLLEAVEFVKETYPKANYNHISRCLHGRRKTAYGYKWKLK